MHLIKILIRSTDTHMEWKMLIKLEPVFLNVFNQIPDIHAPMAEIKQSKKYIKQNTKPWITNDIIKLIRDKDKTYQQFIKESDTALKETIQNKLKEQKNEITKQIRESKKFFYDKYFSRNSSNLKKLWVGINQILNRGKNSNSIPVCIEIDVEGNVQTITDPKVIANTFTTQLQQVKF